MIFSRLPCSRMGRGHEFRVIVPVFRRFVLRLCVGAYGGPVPTGDLVPMLTCVIELRKEA